MSLGPENHRKNSTVGWTRISTRLSPFRKSGTTDCNDIADIRICPNTRIDSIAGYKYIIRNEREGRLSIPNEELWRRRDRWFQFPEDVRNTLIHHIAVVEQ